MAGDWIKMKTDIYRHPKVSVIADRLNHPEGDLALSVNQFCQRNMTVTRNVTRCATVGALVTVWGVFRHRGERDGDDLFVELACLHTIDDVADMPGFGKAMESVGWVVDDELGLRFPRFFEEMNVDTSASKSSAAERQRRYRERKKRDVTRDVTVTSRNALEKEKEKEKENKKSKPKKGGVDLALLKFPDGLPPAEVCPILEDWVAYKSEIGDRVKTNRSLQAVLNQFSDVGVSSLREAVEASKASGWRGIFKPKGGPGGQQQRQNPAMF
jgi:hypothetical protein